MVKALNKGTQLAHYLPIFQWIRSYQRGWLRPDIMAGLTLAAFTIPEALAYAELAGLPAQAGLYASILPPILYTFFGSSRQLVIGPTAAISVLLASGLATLTISSHEQYAALAALTAIMVSIIAIAAYAFRLGFLVNYISESVLLGFATGAGLYIASTQLAKLFGIYGSTGHFFERIIYIIQHLGSTNLWAVLLGLIGVAGILIGERFFPRLPWPLIIVLGSIGILNITDLANRGVHIVGEIPEGFPVFSFPSIVFADIPDLFMLAAAAFLLAYLEGMSMVKTYASKHGYRTDANQELLALGVVSLGAGFTQAYPVAGSFSRTALNDESGAKTQLANGIGGVIIAFVVLFLTGLFTKLPEPILASIVLVAVRGLFKIKELHWLYKMRPIEFWPAIGAFVAVLVFGILEGVAIGALLSLLLVISRASEPRISLLGKIPGQPQFADVNENPENITIPGLLVIRAEEGIFYANAEALRDKINQQIQDCATPVQTVVLDVEMTSDLDLSGAEMLSKLHKDLRDLGVHFRLSRVQPSARALLARTGILEEIGEENIHPRTLFAVAAYLSEEGVHGRIACDILPDMVKCVQDLICNRIQKTEGEERNKLESITRQLETILKELEEISCEIR